MGFRLALAKWQRSLCWLAVVLPLDLSSGALHLARAAEPEANPASSVVSPTTASEATSTDHDEPLARARAVAAVAESWFVAEQYAAALAEYTRAYEILAGHPRQYWVLHNLAACNERLFRYDLAVELYEEYLRRAPATETDRGEVNAVLGTLRSLLATLIIESSVVGEVWLDDRRLGAAPGRWRVPTGRHIVEVRAELYESQRREVQLSGGQVQTARFQLQRLSTYAGPPPTYFWVAVGLTGVATVAGATTGFMALSAHTQGRERAALSLDTQADAERAQRLALASDVAFGTAVVFGATATVLYFVTDWSSAGGPERRAREPSSPRRLSVALAVPGGWGATVRGQF